MFLRRIFICSRAEMLWGSPICAGVHGSRPGALGGVLPRLAPTGISEERFVQVDSGAVVFQTCISRGSAPKQCQARIGRTPSGHAGLGAVSPECTRHVAGAAWCPHHAHPYCCQGLGSSSVGFEIEDGVVGPGLYGFV